MSINHREINAFFAPHNEILHRECMGNNDPQVNIFNAQIREGLSIDPADEFKEEGCREPLFGCCVPSTYVLTMSRDDALLYMEMNESDEPTEADLSMARRQDDVAHAMTNRFMKDEVTVVHQFTSTAKFTESVRTRPGHRVLINEEVMAESFSDLYDREQLHKMLNAPSTKPVRQPRPNPVFNPRLPEEVPSHMQDVAALNAAARGKKSRGSNR